MSDNQFKLQINITKSYVDDNGNHCLEGVASGPEVDLTDERMSPDALKSMVSSIKKCLIEFRDAHKQEWNDDLGEVVELSPDESNHLIYRSVLDKNLSGSMDFWYRVHTLGKKYGVSNGGAVLKAGMEYVAELGRQVYTYFVVDLYDISITWQAANQYSFANAVLKSLCYAKTHRADPTLSLRYALDRLPIDRIRVSKARIAADEAPPLKVAASA